MKYSIGTAEYRAIQRAEQSLLLSPEKLSHVVERLSESQGVSTAPEGKGAALNKVMKMNKKQLEIGEKIYQIY